MCEFLHSTKFFLKVFNSMDIHFFIQLIYPGIFKKNPGKVKKVNQIY